MKTKMKMKGIFAVCVAALLSLQACDDDFLDKRPVVTQSEASLRTYNNFLTYAWSFYNCFTSADYVQSWAMDDIANTSYAHRHPDVMAGFLTSAWDHDTDNPRRTQTVSVPADRNGGTWNFGYIRAVNIMLRNIEDSEMTEVEKRHWRSVGYFFFCYRYAEMISRFGDVTWVPHVLRDDGSDDDIIFGQRTPRKIVADSVLRRLQYAERNINVDGDGPNTVNRSAVQALISRFTLFEGTWRKYHGLGDYDEYFKECTRVSEALMETFPIIDNNYDGMLTTENLGTRPGMILYKDFDIELSITHMLPRYERSVSTHLSMHRFTTDLYLVQSNGLPVTNPANAGRPDVDMYDEFRDRDPRLLMTVCPPYSQDVRYVNFPGQMQPQFVLTSPPQYNTGANYERPGLDKQEYIKWLADNGHTKKRLPAWQFQGTAMIWSVPNFPGTPAAQFRSRSGYTCWRNYSLNDVPTPITGNAQGAMSSDKPIFFIEEVLLNAAEAAWEAGIFDQDYADKTINKLHRRTTVNMPDMVVASINASTDPVNASDKVTPGRDPDVDPVLWEIRRERIVELMCLGYGWADVRRWKKGPWYMNRPILGVKIDKQYYRGLDGSGNVTTTILDVFNNLPLVNKDFSPLVDG